MLDPNFFNVKMLDPNFFNVKMVFVVVLLLQKLKKVSLSM
jgi:hypothetical protein